MTDRYHTLTVVLERDIREDDAELIMVAIRQLRGVLSISGVVSDMESNMAEARARRDFGEAIMGLLYPKEKGK